MISKRRVMVCVRQETSNTMFTILSLNLLSFIVLTTIINVPYMADSRLFFIAVTRCFEITILSFHYVLIWPTREQYTYGYRT